MKFLVSMHYAPPHIGGMESIVEKQLESLHERGHDVALITCRHDRRLPRHERSATHAVTRYRALNVIENRFGVTYPLILPPSFFAILRRVARADAVHIHDVFYELSHLAGLAAVLRRKPFWITQHVALVDHPSALVMAVQKVVYRTIGRFLFRRAVAIVVYNVNVRDFLVGLGIDAAKIVLIHNGIDTDFFAPVSPERKAELKRRHGLPTDRPTALFVGRLVPKKGFDLVARAQAAGRHTLIVGNGAVPDELRVLPGVTFHGAARDTELLELYQAADVFVFPAVGEIFTLVMQEAMACGLPVVTTDDPGYAEYDLDLESIALVPRTTEAIDAAVTAVLADAARAARMSAYSRAVALDRFSWRQNYAGEYGVYAEHLARTSAS